MIKEFGLWIIYDNINLNLPTNQIKEPTTKWGYSTNI